MGRMVSWHYWLPVSININTIVNSVICLSLRSVGVLMYVLLTGCSPFGGDTKQETFCNIAQCKLEFPEELFEDISPAAQDLMRKLMVKKPRWVWLLMALGSIQTFELIGNMFLEIVIIGLLLALLLNEWKGKVSFTLHRDMIVKRQVSR